jgi:hypothetical protein
VGTRTSRLRLVSAALAAAVLASACSGSLVSPAAVVDGHRISERSLESELAALLQRPRFAKQVQGPGGAEQRKSLARQLLASIIQQQIVIDYANRRGLAVSGPEITGTINQQVQQAGGRAAFDAALKAQGLTIADLRHIFFLQLLVQKVTDDLAARHSPATTDPAKKDQLFLKWLTDRLATAHIEVNPRFGRLDLKTGNIVAITSTAA